MLAFICYLRNGVVYLPTFAKVVTVGYLNIDPVAVAAVSDTGALRQALRETIARGNPLVPDPPIDENREPVILKHTNVRTWAAFERHTTVWVFQEDKGICKIKIYRRIRGGWEEDPDRVETLPPGSNLEDVCERMIAILQAKASE